MEMTMVPAGFYELAIFKGLTRDEVEQIGRLANPMHFGKGNLIFQEQNAANYLDIIWEGAVEIRKNDKDGEARLWFFTSRASDLFRAYEAWCKANCERPLANNVFGRIVTSYKGVQKGKSGSKGRHYKGLRLAGTFQLGDGIGDDIERRADPDESEVA
jgi:hypothetical protein